MKSLPISEKDGEEVERMDYLEFVARLTSHIADKGQVTIRCFGLYANAHRGQVHKSEEGQPKPLIIEEECPRISRRTWAIKNSSWPLRPQLNIFHDLLFN